VRRTLVLPLVLAALAASTPDAPAQDARAAVEAFVARVSDVQINDLVIDGARPGDHESPAVWLDPDYGVVRLVTRERNVTRNAPPGGSRLVDLTFSEHRPLVGRLYFPYRQEVFVDGKLLVLFTVRSVAINTNPADALFDPASLKSP